MNRMMLGAGLLIAAMGLSGCMPKPRVDANGQQAVPTVGEMGTSEMSGATDQSGPRGLPVTQPRFGQFNIHKRHGLGGWEQGSPQGSEKDLLRRMSQSPVPSR